MTIPDPKKNPKNSPCVSERLESWIWCGRRQLLHSWLPYERAPNAKTSRASPVVLRLADQRHWSRLAFSMAVNKPGLPARPSSAIPRHPSRASPGQGGTSLIIISLAARKARPPRRSHPRPRTSNHHVSAALCLIIAYKSHAIPRHPSRASPGQGNIVSLAARSRPRPRTSRSYPRTSSHHVSATLCLIISPSEVPLFCKATSYPTPPKALP